jgi:hypothetical protein
VSIASSNEISPQSDLPATVTVITDAARAEGMQQVTYRQGGTSGRETVEEVGGVGYLKGDAFTLQYFNGFTAETADRYSDVWLSVTTADGAFAKLTSGLTMATLPEQLSMPGSTVIKGATTVSGQRVTKLTSTATISSHTVISYLYVRARGLRLPVEQTFKEAGIGSGSDRYSQWNKPVAVTAPTKTVPLSSTGQ